MSPDSAGIRDLQVLLQGMNPALGDQVYVFLSIPFNQALPQGTTPLLTFRESEGLTIVVPQDRMNFFDSKAECPCRLITLNVHSSLNAIGFLAIVTTALAGAGISVNTVSAFYHDHLLVPADKAEDALRVLKDLAHRE